MKNEKERMSGAQTFTVQIGPVANQMCVEHWNKGVDGCKWSWHDDLPVVLCVDAKV